MANEYEVGVKLTPIGGIAEALAAVSARVLALNAQVVKTGEAFAGWKTALAGVGGILVSGGDHRRAQLRPPGGSRQGREPS